MRQLPLLLLLVATSARGQSAPPEDPIESAKRLYAEGKRYYDIADYEHAIASWKRAYVASNASMLLFDIAQAHRLSGNCTEAMHVYAAYERATPELTNRVDLEQAKDRCNREPTKAHPPEPAKEDVTAAAPAQQPPPPPPTRHDHTLQIAGVATGSVGVLLGVTSFVFARRARDVAEQVSAHRGEWTATERALEREGHDAGTLAVVTGVAGGVALVGGVALYYLGRESTSRVDVAVAPAHAEVTWSVSF